MINVIGRIFTKVTAQSRLKKLCLCWAHQEIYLEKFIAFLESCGSSFPVCPFHSFDNVRVYFLTEIFCATLTPPLKVCGVEVFLDLVDKRLTDNHQKKTTGWNH